MCLILNIDSSLAEGSVSIARNGTVLAHFTNNEQKDHAAFLHRAIDNLLTNLMLAPADLEAIAVTAGPGSYTGLRVGFSAAKGLSYALGRPLISIPTTEVMAKALQPAHGSNTDFFCPLIDARRDEVFTAVYDANIAEIIAPHAMIVTPSSFEDFFPGKRMVFFGSGAEKFKNICRRPHVFFADVVPVFPAFALCSQMYFSSGRFAEIARSAPLYGKAFYKG